MSCTQLNDHAAKRALLDKHYKTRIAEHRGWGPAKEHLIKYDSGIDFECIGMLAATNQGEHIITILTLDLHLSTCT